MRYGKIRVEDGNLIFFRHMIQNNLPCRELSGRISIGKAKTQKKQ